MKRYLSFVLFFGLLNSPMAGATPNKMAVNLSGTWSGVILVFA